MNKECFQVIFSKSQQQFVVVSELAKSAGKSSTVPKAKVDDLFSLLFENLFSNRNSNLNPITSKDDSTNARRLYHFSLNEQQEVRTVTPNLQLPNNRIYRLNSPLIARVSKRVLIKRVKQAHAWKRAPSQGIYIII